MTSAYSISSINVVSFDSEFITIVVLTNFDNNQSKDLYSRITQIFPEIEKKPQMNLFNRRKEENENPYTRVCCWGKTWTLKQMIEIKRGKKKSTYGKPRHRGRRKFILFLDVCDKHMEWRTNLISSDKQTVESLKSAKLIAIFIKNIDLDRQMGSASMNSFID